MIGRTNAGGGGASLNYKLVGGTSQPASPSANTVWVNTEAAITSHVFAADQPTGAEGMVWIKTGTASGAAMSVTKKNPVMVYPLDCKQYVSGAWVSKTAMSYLNGAWVPWRVYLFKQGEGPSAGWPNYTRNMGVNVTDQRIAFVGGGAGQQYQGANVKRNARLDLTGVSKIVFRVNALTNQYMACGVWATDPTAYGAAFTKSVSTQTQGEQTLELDVSDLSGEHTVGAYVEPGAYTAAVDVAYIYDIYYS